MQKDEEIVFRTPEIPKLRRRKSLPNTSSASKEDRKSQISLVSTRVYLVCARYDIKTGLHKILLRRVHLHFPKV